MKSNSRKCCFRMLCSGLKVKDSESCWTTNGNEQTMGTSNSQSRSCSVISFRIWSWKGSHISTDKQRINYIR